MATKVCAICEKQDMAGRRIQHHHSVGWRFKAPRSLRVFKTNMRKVDINVNNTVVRANVCMKCYKKLKKEDKA